MLLVGGGGGVGGVVGTSTKLDCCGSDILCFAVNCGLSSACDGRLDWTRLKKKKKTSRGSRFGLAFFMPFDMVFPSVSIGPIGRDRRTREGRV